MSVDNEKNVQKSVQISDEVLGEVRIADSVVANIAVLAAKETEGVYDTVGNAANEIMTKVGVKSASKGVRVAIIDGIVSVDLALIMQYGFNIPTTCKKVQDRVKNSIENMTGLEVTDVNIRIAGVNTAQI
ncbi:MAG: Asp23/Gls24 family envelope stress response protein [Lachnospiraceae bacterium]|nr:Asp23/Gls24 family envelope stress response protein [Lachnospiraceae bacterium]